MYLRTETRKNFLTGEMQTTHYLKLHDEATVINYFSTETLIALYHLCKQELEKLGWQEESSGEPIHRKTE